MSQFIKNAPFFVIRTPRLPLQLLDGFSRNDINHDELLEAWLAMPGVKEAIYLASPSLLERLEQWRQKPDSKQGRKVARALIKYMVRMCSRPTPFGLFSGIHKGKVADSTNLMSAGHVKDRRKTRLDMFYLSALKKHLVKDAARSGTLTYKPNPSHYFIGDDCRYIETSHRGEGLQYKLSSVDSDEYVQFVLRATESGLSFNALVDAFYVEFSGIEKADIEDYLQALIDEGMLVADIPLPLTGDSPDQALLKSILAIEAHELADQFATALAQLEQLDSENSGDIKPYKALIEHFENLPVKPKENRLFQSDTYRAFDSCQLSETEIKRVVRQVELISGLNAADTNNPLDHFISQFNKRFEGQFVPLNQVLDDESGISLSNETSYDAPLIAGLNLNRQQSIMPAPPAVTLLDKLIEDAITLPGNRGKDCIVLNSKELKGKLKNKQATTRYPGSFAVMLSAYEDDKKNPVYKFRGGYGPSSANLLGRFCHLDESLKNDVIEELNKEQAQSPDVVFAEVVHMPEGRPGNVIARPHLRRYEIVFMADSSLDNEFQIPLSDLYVWVEGKKVKLWSKRLNKQIVPRLSSAHNYTSRSLNAYKFLCMLQHQEGRGPNFRMPFSTNRDVFVPCIMLDNLILNEKTWRIERELLEKVAKSGESYGVELESLCQKYRLDPFVNFAMRDNVLQLDLRNPDMLAILLDETKGYTRIELKEVLSRKFRSRVTDDKGNHYDNEIILPFINTQATPVRHYIDDPLANIAAKPIKRRFSAGSEWLSLKIYSGNSQVENVLHENILPLIEENAELFDKWFFIRYGDPDWHIRLRFQGEPAILCGQLLPKLNAMLDPMIESGKLHKVELMTYEREVERYGGPDSMTLIESLFMADSMLIAKVCRLIGEHDESIRWRVSCLCIERLLALFEFDEQARFALIDRLRKNFGTEFNENGELRKKLGARFRFYESQMKEDSNKLNMEYSGELCDAQKSMQDLLGKWQASVASVVADLNKLIKDRQLNCPRDALLSSILHMHNNRMFKAYGRAQEFVIYDLLRRKYLGDNVAG